MRLVVQRVQRAAVRIEGEVVGEIGPGAVVLVGIGQTDDEATVDRMADKLAGLRYFADADGRANLTIADAGGSFLVVSQFTLYGDARKGRRPTWQAAAPAPVSEPLYEALCAELERLGAHVERGVFGADMRVESVNDGPITVLLETG
jgi:D-tyrosyl-tRNA(Tyr) deacylase